MKIVLTPEWFLGKDVAIDIFSFVILFIFFLLCLANYKIDKKKNFVYLGGGFLLVALGQLSTILTKLVLYYDTTVTQQIGQVIVTSHILSSVDILYHLGFFLNRFFTLLGLFIIYKMLDKSKKTFDIIIITYFIILSARKKRIELQKNLRYVSEVLETGAIKAKKIASATMAEVKQKTGLRP